MSIIRVLATHCTLATKAVRPHQCFLKGHRTECFRVPSRSTFNLTGDDDQSQKSPKKKSKKSKDSLTDESSGGVPKKKGRKKKQPLTDEEIMDSLITFVPFEGIAEENSDVCGEPFCGADFAFKKQDLPDGRFYHHFSSKNSFSFPSVTTVLDKTMEKSNSYLLTAWKRKLTELHGKEGFNTIRNNTLQSGTDFHKELELRLLKSLKRSPRDYSSSRDREDPAKLEAWSGPDSELKSDSCKGSSNTQSSKLHPPQQNEEEKDQEHAPARYMESVEHILDDIGEVKALETSIANFSLGYVGTFDCLANYKGTLCLIDWKTSKKPKSSLADCYDYPLQAVAYAGAINHDPRINLKVFNILLVIAYADGMPAHAHLINHTLCRKYWLRWLQRLQAYQTQFSEDLSELIN